MNIYTRLYKRAAEKLKYKYELINGKNIIIYKGNKRVSFSLASYGENRVWDYKMAKNKEYTKKILKKNNIPILKSGTYNRNDLSRAVDFVKNKLKFPVVVKPIDQSGGSGISVNINSVGKLKESFKEAGKFSENIMIEKYYKGNDYRFLICRNKVLAVSQREPAYIIGNGKSNIGSLIKKRNKINKYNFDIKDKYFIKTLKYLNINLSDIPEKKQKYYISSISNISAGGVSRNILLKNVNTDYKKIAINSAKAMNLKFCGVDILSMNLKDSINKTNACVIEINASPGLKMHYYSKENSMPEIAEKVLKYL
jgi:cyanophycin synthetase